MAAPRACIVGGGPAGLTQARVLASLGIEYTIFEAAEDFGGLWNHDNPASPIYPSAHLISSRDKSGFQDYPMPGDWADYPSAGHILRYIRDFAQARGLYAHARLGEGVEKAVPTEDGWEVTTTKGATERFRWLIAANGSNWKPFMPDWPGTGARSEPKNTIVRHSSTYKSVTEFAGKRVLVIGLGNSGVDIACDATHLADSVTVSVRRGYHVVPKMILGKPADVFRDDAPPLPLPLRRKFFEILLRFLVGDLSRYGMPKPDHRLLETHPLLSDPFVHHLRHGDIRITGDIAAINGGTVSFTSGEEDRFDDIIAATGFEWEIPYIDPALLPWDHGRLHPPLAIFPEQNNLFLLSFVETNGSSFSLFNEMAWIIGHAIHAGRDQPAEAEKLRTILKTTHFDSTGGLRMVASNRHVGYMDNAAYRKNLGRLRRMMGWPKTGRPQSPDAP